MSTGPRLIEEKLKAHILTRMTRNGGFEEQLKESYPLWAVRELFLNSLMHRDWESHKPNRFYVFQDRIELENPGGLYGEATIENFPNVNSYRNPVIAEALKILGFVNRFGYGIQRAQRLLAENGNPPAEITPFQHSLKAVLYAL